MKIGKPKPKGLAGVPMPWKKGDPTPPGYTPPGQPTKYRPEYCKSIVDYFDRSAWEITTDLKGASKVMPKENVPTLIRWCRALGVGRRTVHGWTQTIPEFAEAYETAMELQKAFLMEAGLTQPGAGGFAMFMLKCNHGMMEPKQDTEDKEDGPIQRVVVEVVGANQHKGD
jgi:hypothetical protein